MEGTAAARASVDIRLARARLSRVRSLGPLSVYAHVVGLILAVVIPLLAFSAFLVLRSAVHEQEQTANLVQQRAREAASTIDHELGVQRTKAFMLAGSQHLQSGDLAAFREEAIAAVRQDGLSVVLSDLSGQQLVNTRAPLGATLPIDPDAEDIRWVATANLPNVSKATRDPVTGAYVTSINIPVRGEGRLTYVLSLDVMPVIPQVLTDLRLPPDWIIAIDDRIGRTIARSRDPERYVGQMGRPEIVQQFAAVDEGWFPLISRDGIPIYNALVHVKSSGWTVALGIPDAVLFAPVRHSTLALILTGGVTVALALVLAFAIGQRIAGSITSLVGYANVVGRGEHIDDCPKTGVKEVNAVADSLRLASDRLRQIAMERAVLLERTVTAQESERKRIARELHDSLGQYLTALRLGFTAIEPICACDLTAQQRLAQLKKLAASLGQELNRIAWELRPMALDDFGLHRAITQYLEEWAERSRLQIDLEINLGETRLPHEIETALFRVLQEAITNVVKHAGATHVGVIATAADHDVRLIVEDDGKGFDVGDDAGAMSLGIQHLGLLGVRERLALVGGTLDVESTARGGTTVYVRIPLGG